VYTSEYFLKTFNVDDFLQSRMQHAEMMKKGFPSMTIVERDPGHPISISMDYFRPYKKSENTKLTEHLFRSLEAFEYDAMGKLLSWSTSQTELNGQQAEILSNRTLNFDYNADEKLSGITDGDKKISILYDINNNISELIIARDGIMMQRHQFHYNENNLRTKAEAFNKHNGLEYSQDYVYRYF
jgi:hypothetical protein